MYKYCKQIIKLNQVPAIINKNINTDIQFKKEFELSTQLIMLNEAVAQRDNRRDLFSSLIGGLLLSLSVYGLYEVYFSKSEQQLLKLKLSVKCYLRSYYYNDLSFIITYLHDMQSNAVKNTGFVIYLLQTLKHNVNKQNYDDLCTIYSEVSNILLSHETYQRLYAKQFSKMFAEVLDYAILNDLPFKCQLLQPSLLCYLYSDNILNQIQSLSVLSKYQLSDQSHLTSLKRKMQKDSKANFIETNELFDMLKNQYTQEGYEEFKVKYQNSLETQKQRLLKLTAQKQNLRM